MKNMTWQTEGLGVIEKAGQRWGAQHTQAALYSDVEEGEPHNPALVCRTTTP